MLDTCLVQIGSCCVKLQYKFWFDKVAAIGPMKTRRETEGSCCVALASTANSQLSISRKMVSLIWSDSGQRGTLSSDLTVDRLF